MHKIKQNLCAHFENATINELAYIGWEPLFAVCICIQARSQRGGRGGPAPPLADRAPPLELGPPKIMGPHAVIVLTVKNIYKQQC